MSTRSREAEDAAYSRALEAVRELGLASIPLIQSKTRCSYNGAAAFLTRMRSEGVIGPANAEGVSHVIA